MSDPDIPCPNAKPTITTSRSEGSHTFQNSLSDPYASPPPVSEPPSPSPPTSPPPNFTGSSVASDFVFDFDIPPHCHPADVQAYLYLVGADNPTLDGKGFDAGMAAGVQRLRDARARGYGLFLDGPPSATAMDACPNFPWLWGLSYAQVQAIAEANKVPQEGPFRPTPLHFDLAWQSTMMVLGNARVPLPEHLVRANDPQWLEIIAAMYSGHPANVKTDHCDGLTWPSDRALRILRDYIIWDLCPQFGRGDFWCEEEAEEFDPNSRDDFEPVI